jgi:hypothetical protein
MVIVVFDEPIDVKPIDSQASGVERYEQIAQVPHDCICRSASKRGVAFVFKCWDPWLAISSQCGEARVLPSVVWRLRHSIVCEQGTTGTRKERLRRNLEVLDTTVKNDRITDRLACALGSTRGEADCGLRFSPPLIFHRPMMMLLRGIIDEGWNPFGKPLPIAAQ